MNKGLNASEVLANIEAKLKEAEEYKEENKNRSWMPKNKRWRIREVYKELSIFDWWNDYLSVSQLKQMKSFIKQGMKRGFNGYVCFKVGAKYCANGMWIHKNESEDGYSPSGECLYHSFVSGENYWDTCDENEIWMGTHEKYRFTLDEVDEELARRKAIHDAQAKREEEIKDGFRNKTLSELQTILDKIMEQKFKSIDTRDLENDLFACVRFAESVLGKDITIGNSVVSFSEEG